MNDSLAEHFNMFVDNRLNQFELSIENDSQYQELQHILYDMKNIPDVALSLHDNLQTIAEKHAYRQGFIDGLTLMAGCST